MTTNPRPRSMTSRATRRAVVALATLLAVASLAIDPPPAEAASGDYGKISATTEHRDCPDTRCAVQRNIPAGTWVPVLCWRDAGSANGTTRWFRVRYGTDAWVSAARVTSQPSVPYCSDLRPGETLFSGQSVWSSNGSYRLVMQGDGNLVAYGPSGALWSTRTAGSGANRVVMQRDGNFVVYTPSNVAKWHTGTSNGGAYVAMQSDSNLVLYSGSTALYASNWHRTWGQTRTTNNSSGWGWCTWYALEMFKGYTGTYPNLWGDAHNWNDAAAARGWRVQGTPSAHSIIVFEPNLQGSGSVGHVGWVTGVQLRSDGTWVHITEMNYRGFGVVSTRWVKHEARISYIMAPSL